MSGPHSLKHIASNSVEILSGLPRTGGRQKNQAQMTAGAYFKVLKALVELEAVLNEAGVDAAALPQRHSGLVLATTIPIMVAAPPPPHSNPPPVGLQTAWPSWLKRLRWVVCIYLPLALVGTAAVIAACTSFHVATNPEIIMDATVDAAISFVWAAPRYVVAAGRKVAAAVFRKISSGSTPQRPAHSYNAINVAEQFKDPENDKALLVFLVLIALGWVLSARPPARPADM